MDVRWSKGCDIPTSESSNVQPLTNIFLTKILENHDILLFSRKPVTAECFFIHVTDSILLLGLCFTKNGKALFNFGGSFRKWISVFR